jgi:tRNA-dihydrouridine synthase
MRDAAAAMAAAGADVVDINLGCPAPRVVRKGVGSAMLKDPALLHEVLVSMRSVVPGLLSAKIRAGFDEADQVVAIARTVQSAGVDFIAVHPRRRADFYRGVADWRIIRTLKDALDIPVVGNGDVWYADDALRMIDETGCDAVMIGRPALRNPWIFRQVSERLAGVEPFRPSGADVADAFDDLVQRYLRARTGGPHGPVGRIKEWITFLGRAVLDDGAWRHAALRMTDLSEICAFTRASLASLGPDDLDLGPSNQHGIETSGSAVQRPYPSGD